VERSGTSSLDMFLSDLNEKLPKGSRKIYYIQILLIEVEFLLRNSQKGVERSHRQEHSHEDNGVLETPERE
ncbi:MAG: hypothetical protein QXK54_05360, partial [Ignisphaera sp.]